MDAPELAEVRLPANLDWAASHRSTAVPWLQTDFCGNSQSACVFYASSGQYSTDHARGKSRLESASAPQYSFFDGRRSEDFLCSRSSCISRLGDIWISHILDVAIEGRERDLLLGKPRSGNLHQLDTALPCSQMERIYHLRE